MTIPWLLKPLLQQEPEILGLFISQLSKHKNVLAPLTSQVLQQGLPKLSTHQTWRGAHRKTRRAGRIPHCQSFSGLLWGRWRCHCQPCCRWEARKPAAKWSFSSGRWPLLSCLSPWLSSNHRGRSHIQELQSPKCPQGSPVRQGVRDSRIFFSGQNFFQ